MNKVPGTTIGFFGMFVLNEIENHLSHCKIMCFVNKWQKRSIWFDGRFHKVILLSLLLQCFRLMFHLSAFQFWEFREWITPFTCTNRLPPKSKTMLKVSIPLFHYLLADVRAQVKFQQMFALRKSKSTRKWNGW